MGIMLRKLVVTCLSLSLLIAAQSAQAQIRQPGQSESGGSEAVNITCETEDIAVVDGTTVTMIQLRSGAYYTATVIGIDDFDPVVITTSSTDRTTSCNDDSEIAAEYSATLPGIGTVSGSENSAQVTFHQTVGDLQDVHINVGGKDGMSGEFLLIIQGMALTELDGSGDPFEFHITERVANSGIPFEVYMFRAELGLDPTIWTLDDENADYLVDQDEEDYIFCDDAGAPSLCWGDNSYLNTSQIVTDTETFNGALNDAMISIDPDFILDRGMESLYFLMSSYYVETFGDYVLVFHIGIE